MNEPKWQNDDWKSVRPDHEKIACKDCFLREKDRKIGDTTIHGCSLSFCQAFSSKPTEILSDGADCDYYISEKETGDEE